MFKVINENDTTVLLEVELPAGQTAEQLLNSMDQELETLAKASTFYGKDVKINGRITTYMCAFAGHKLAHICKSVSIFVPQENQYITVIKH